MEAELGFTNFKNKIFLLFLRFIFCQTVRFMTFHLFKRLSSILILIYYRFFSVAANNSFLILARLSARNRLRLVISLSSGYSSVATISKKIISSKRVDYIL